MSPCWDNLRCAAAEAKDNLKSLSAERIAKELLRLLEVGNPAPVLRVMAATGILSVLLPGALASRGEAMGAAFVGSLTMGSGQFCTNPGLVLDRKSVV